MSADIKKYPGKYLPLIVLPLALIIVLGSNLSQQNVIRIHSENGIWDLRDFDLTNANVAFEGYAGFIPNALLTPAEFAERENEQEFRDPRFEDFITSRLIILVPDDGWYSFSRISAFPSHRVYVNGEFLHEIGSPGASRSENIPNTGRITFSVRPVDGVIEIVQQSANFVHREGSMHHTWEMSAGMAVFENALATDFRDSILMGMHLMIFLVFTIIFFTLRGSTNNRGTLYCALFCLTWFLRMGMVNGGVIKSLVPGLSWFVTFRIEYIAMPVATVLVVIIVATLFPGVLHKNYLRYVFAGSAIFVLICLFADILFMSQTLYYFYVYLGITILLLVAQIVMKVRKTSPAQLLLIVGILVFVASSVFDVFHFSFPYSRFAPPFSFSGIALLTFALCQSTAVFLATMREMEAAREAERRLAEENASLDKLNRTKTEFLQDMNHEIRTPLTVIASGIDFVDRQLNADDEKMKPSRAALDTIRNQVQRIGRMLGGMSALAKMGELSGNRKRVNFAALLKNGAETFRIQLEKHGNSLHIDIAPGLPDVFIEQDRFTQVITNLMANAAENLQGGKITVTAALNESGSFITVRVKDNGGGIAPELLPRLFERGVSGRGGTGYGLFICKTIVDAHGGNIEIKNEPASGTTVIFTVPVYGGQEAGHKA